MKVRTLSPDTPGVPPPVPWPYTPQCPGDLGLEHVPERLRPRLDPWCAGLYCTQPEHGEDTPHACHLRATSHDDKPGELLAIVVWGGE